MATREQLEEYEMQNSLQQNQLDAQQNMYAPQLMEQVQQNQAVLVEQTNPRKIVKEIMLRLQGKEENPDGTTSIVATPKLNKNGIDDVWYILDSHINQNVIYSHLDDREISKIMDQLGQDLVRDLSLNSKYYGLRSSTDKDIIINSILINIFLALKRAEGQNEKNWIGKVSIENISSASRQMPIKREGFWSKFKL